MTTPADFPDIEAVLMDGLEAEFPALAGGQHTGDETPEDLQARFPFVRVAVVGGQDDRVTDQSAVDVDVFDSTRAGARNLAEAIRTWLIGYPHRVGENVIDYVFTEQKPQRLPWDEENTRRFGATYRISARR